MKKYKVIKDYDILIKGQIFEQVNGNKYVASTEDSSNGYKYISKITIDAGFMSFAIANGYMIEMDCLDTTNYKQLYDRYKRLYDENDERITKLIDKYNELAECAKFDFGEILICSASSVTEDLKQLKRN